MRILIFILLFASPVLSSEYVRFVDGKIQFANCTVNGVQAWTVAEKDALVAATTGSVSIVNYSISQNEINLSTCIVGFTNRTDFLKFQTKRELLQKIKELKQEADTYTELGQPIPADLRDRFRWLKHYYATLP